VPILCPCSMMREDVLDGDPKLRPGLPEDRSGRIVINKVNESILFILQSHVGLVTGVGSMEL
jgi:hypothetical protein